MCVFVCVCVSDVNIFFHFLYLDLGMGIFPKTFQQIVYIFHLQTNYDLCICIKHGCKDSTLYKNPLI